MRFADKVALVTGSANGLGKGIAEAFLQEGATVAGLDLLPTDARGVHSLQADVRDYPALAAALATLERVDILVNCAVYRDPPVPTWEVDPTQWRQTLDVSLTGCFLCCKAVLPGMMTRKRGVIINLSSTAGHQAYPLRSAYATAKWGMLGLTRTLAAEAGEYGIRVNAVCPGPVEGERMQQVVHARAQATGSSEEAVRAEYTANSVLKEFVEPRSVIETVLFLASDAAASVTGALWNVDSGYRI